MCALVGNLAYRLFCKLLVLKWTKATWEPILGYSPMILTLPRGWFGFVFNSPKYYTNILKNLWIFEGGILMLKWWRPKFDLATKYFSFRHLWVLLSGLPLQLWNSKALEAIGKFLCRFIKIDEEALLLSDWCMAKILVEVDVNGGLLDTLEIEWCGIVIEQRLDYLRVLLCFSGCRHIGHLKKDLRPPYGVYFD